MASLLPATVVFRARRKYIGHSTDEFRIISLDICPWICIHGIPFTDIHGEPSMDIIFWIYIHGKTDFCQVDFLSGRISVRLSFCLVAFVSDRDRAGYPDWDTAFAVAFAAALAAARTARMFIRSSSERPRARSMRRALLSSSFLIEACVCVCVCV